MCLADGSRNIDYFYKSHIFISVYILQFERIYIHDFFPISSLTTELLIKNIPHWFWGAAIYIYSMLPFSKILEF